MRTADPGSGSVQQSHSAPMRGTRQRAAVLAALRECEGFVGAQELHARLALRGQGVGLSTVYRTLQVLAALGEIDAIVTPEGQARYRGCSLAVAGEHHHLVCRRCGLTVEVHNASVARWVTRVARANGFADTRHRLDIIGMCRRCAD